MPKPTKSLYRVATTGKPGAEGKFQTFESLDELKAAFPDLTGVKVKKFKLKDEGTDIDPSQPEPPEDETEEGGTPV